MSAQSFLKVASQTWSIALWSDELGAVVAEFEELLDEATVAATKNENLLVLEILQKKIKLRN